MIEVTSYSELEDLFKKTKDSKELERIKTIMSMRETLARRNANNIWGNGFVFNSGEKDLNNKFEEFNKRNRLNDLFHYAENIKSLYGRVVITMNKNKSGHIMLGISDPWFYAQVGKVFVTETLAVIWQRVITDQKHFFLRSEYTTEYVKNNWYEEGAGKYQLVWDVEKQIPKALQVEHQWNHHLGFIPLLETFNYPYRNLIWNQYQFYQLADWYNCEFLEDTFFEILWNLKKEVKICHSRVAVENATQELINKLNQGGAQVELGDYIIQTDVGSRVTAVAGIGDFTKYTNAMDAIMDFYFKFSNSSKFSEGGGAQKTTGEVAQSRNNTIETIRQKITHNQMDYTQLIAKCLIAEGANFEYESEYPFEFKINGNIQKDDTVYLDNIIKQVNLGTMSIQEAIAELRNTNLTKSKEIFDEIQKFNEDNNIMTSNSAMSMDFENDYEGSSKQQEGGRKPEGVPN